jgi:hypothetical protein
MLDDFRDFYDRMPLPVAPHLTDSLLSLVADSDYFVVFNGLLDDVSTDFLT